jgi:hypothetical protein
VLCLLRVCTTGILRLLFRYELKMSVTQSCTASADLIKRFYLPRARRTSQEYAVGARISHMLITNDGLYQILATLSFACGRTYKCGGKSFKQFIFHCSVTLRASTRTWAYLSSIPYGLSLKGWTAPCAQIVPWVCYGGGGSVGRDLVAGSQGLARMIQSSFKSCSW